MKAAGCDAVAGAGADGGAATAGASGGWLLCEASGHRGTGWMGRPTAAVG